MLKLVHTIGEFPFSQVMEVYTESNLRNAAEQWPEETAGVALHRAEMEFYQYLRYDFFTMGGSVYALWLEKEKVVSAVRFEKWKDGILMEGLETHPDYRGRGFACRLLDETLQMFSERIYSHVARDNGPSLHVHKKCGFHKGADSAMVNGNFDSNYITLIKESSHP